VLGKRVRDTMLPIQSPIYRLPTYDSSSTISLPDISVGDKVFGRRIKDSLHHELGRTLRNRTDRPLDVTLTLLQGW
jgi:hypothetical protein